MKLATDRALTDEARRELRLLIDARSWFLGIVAKDYDAELAGMERDLEIELSA